MSQCPRARQDDGSKKRHAQFHKIAGKFNVEEEQLEGERILKTRTAIKHLWSDSELELIKNFTYCAQIVLHIKHTIDP